MQPGYGYDTIDTIKFLNPTGIKGRSGTSGKIIPYGFQVTDDGIDNFWECWDGANTYADYYGE